ncbi:MAG: (Fe-S)-binding protein [Candidatus Ranarchaeia archaeon]
MINNTERIHEPISLDDEYQICAQCGYCNTICPTFQFWEVSGPRGKLWALREKSKKGQKVPVEIVKNLYECTLCGKCQEVCQTDIPLISLWYKTREQAYSQNNWPDGFQRLHKSIENKHNIFGLDSEDRIEWAFEIEDEVEEVWEKHAENCYFVGCVTSYKGMNAKIAESIVDVFQKLKIDFTMLGGEEWCCGSPYFVTGANELGKKNAEHNFTKMKELGIKRIITGCPGCYKSFKFEYPKIIGKDFDIEVLHTVEWMEKMISEGKIKFNEKDGLDITYHDPCELGRHCGIYEAPRKVLNSIPGVNLKEMETKEELANCCGGGGALAVINEKMTDGIALKRVQEAEKTGAKRLVTACPTCQFTFFKAIKESKSELKVQDIMELISRSLEE